MLNAIKTISNDIYNLLTMSFNIDNYTISMWQIYLVSIIFCVISYVVKTFKKG